MSTPEGNHPAQRRYPRSRSYFPAEERRRFIDQLTELSHRRPLVWLSAEATGIVEPVAGATVPEAPPKSDVLGALVFERGDCRERPPGFVHEHGGWIDWRA